MNWSDDKIVLTPLSASGRSPSLSKERGRASQMRRGELKYLKNHLKEK